MALAVSISEEARTQKRPDWLQDPPSLLFSEYRRSFQGVKRPECQVDNPGTVYLRGYLWKSEIRELMRECCDKPWLIM